MRDDSLPVHYRLHFPACVHRRVLWRLCLWLPLATAMPRHQLSARTPSSSTSTPSSVTPSACESCKHYPGDRHAYTETSHHFWHLGSLNVATLWGPSRRGLIWHESCLRMARSVCMPTVSCTAKRATWYVHGFTWLVAHAWTGAPWDRNRNAPATPCDYFSFGVVTAFYLVIDTS